MHQVERAARNPGRWEAEFLNCRELSQPGMSGGGLDKQTVVTEGPQESRGIYRAWLAQVQGGVSQPTVGRGMGEHQTGGRHSRTRAGQRQRPGRASRDLWGLKEGSVGASCERDLSSGTLLPQSPALSPLGPMEMTPLSADCCLDADASWPTWNHPEPRKEGNALWPGSLAALESRV